MSTAPDIHILLVDDQPANLTVLQTVLSELEGVRLVPVTSGEAALRELLARDFALVLLDVQMPTMSGFETAELIRSHPRSSGVPIIFLTAASDPDFPVEQAYALGAVDYMTKPFNPLVLRAKVAVFIDLYRKNAELARIEESRHQSALRSRDERIRLILDNTRDYAFIGTDVERRVTEWEGGAAAITGWSAEQALGQSADIIFTQEDRAAGAPDGEAARALETGRSDDKRWHVRRDGSRFFADGVMVALRDERGQLRGYAKILRDATAERLAAERLEQSETERRLTEAERERLYREVRSANERMTDIFQRAPAFMCVMRGPEHVFELANQRYSELMGGRELVGRPVAEAAPEVADQGFLELLDGVYRSGEAFEGSNVRMLLRPAGGGPGMEEHFVDFVYMALREPDDTISGVLVHGVDVTERTRANLLAVGQRSALELAVTDAPIGDVLDVLAHTAEDYAGGAALAAIQLVEPDGARLRHVAAPSLPRELQAVLDAPGVAPCGGAGPAAAWRGETVACPDIATDPLWVGVREAALAHGLRACRAVPILSPAGAVLGSFCWYYREARQPGAPEQEAMGLLANTASLVLGQRHEAQQRQAAEERSRTILESMSDGFLAVGPDWRVTYANSAAEQVTQRPREELVGGQFWDLFPQVRGTDRERGYRRTASERVRSRVEAYLDEHGRWFEINSFPTPDGGIALYFRDETERRRAEEGIRRLAAVAEQSSDYIGISTLDGQLIYLNPAGRRMTGLAPDDDVRAWTIDPFLTPECREFVRREIMPALLGEPGQWEGELRFVNVATGTPLPVYYKGFAVRDAEGGITCLATITRDITEPKRAEDELRRIAADLAEADHRKSEFLATLAHELRNPLAPIRTGLDLMRFAPGDAASRERVHEMMDRQLGHLIHLVDDLLDVARITRGKIDLKKEVVDLRAAAAMALETCAAQVEASGHALSVQLPDEPLEVDADVTRMVQVLSNLLNNAAKYTPRGGRITLSAWREDGQALVAVTDTGVGIAAESLGSVFEMFTQVRSSLDRAQGGLGIGLSLVRRLVELHGGRVCASSAGRGEGSTFTVRLPLLPPGKRGAGRHAAPGETAEAAPRGLRVLVVDDNVDAADSLVALLGMLGHTTASAHDGPQGYRLAQEFRPDLVFLDIGLPGMSGHEVARAIRRTKGLEQVVLIALTGWGAAGDMAQSQEAGFDQHLTKPVSLEALEQAFAAAGEARP